MKTLVLLVFAVSLLGCRLRPLEPEDLTIINPKPVERYPIHIKIEGLSADYPIRGKVSYDVVDDQCLPIDQMLAIGGARAKSVRDIPISVDRYKEGSYVFIYDDMVIPAKRWDVRKCQWRINSMALYVAAKNSYSAAVFSEDEVKKISKLKYCGYTRDVFVSINGRKYGICDNRKPNDGQKYFTISIERS